MKPPKTIKPQQITGFVFQAFFKHEKNLELMESESNPNGQPYSCLVIAQSFDQALEKIRAFYPGLSLTMLHAQERVSYDDKPRLTRVIL